MDYINEVFNLAELIDYSDDSTISKIIYKTDHTILTLFSMDKGQSIAEHVTPFEAMVQVLDGEADITIGDKTIIVKAGESIIMPANVQHKLFARKRYKKLLVMMKA